MGKENKYRAVNGDPWSSACEKTKLVAAVDARKNSFVFKIEEAYESLRLRYILEKEFRGVVSGNTARKNAADPT